MLSRMSMKDPTTLALVLMASGLTSAAIAGIKGRSFLLFGLLGALVPIVVVYAIFMRRKVRCPGCRERIWRAAKRCPYCWMPPVLRRQRSPRRIPAFGINIPQ
jgi:hypothetical protein